jgi:hypothetical protein
MSTTVGGQARKGKQGGANDQKHSGLEGIHGATPFCGGERTRGDSATLQVQRPNAGIKEGLNNML